MKVDCGAAGVAAAGGGVNVDLGAAACCDGFAAGGNGGAVKFDFGAVGTGVRATSGGKFNRDCGG